MKAMVRNRWFLGALMVVALGLAVWFIGPAIAIFDARPLESVTVRLVLVSCLVILWLGYEAGRIWAARQANQRLLEGIAGGVDADPSGTKAAQEVEQLRKRFQEVATTLKNAKFEGSDGEKQYLYQLPWYVFIGAPGSGKTTALVNSGLRFPIGDGKEGFAVKGVGGTRNCDWWFTDEAVLLDTAGRYSTQDSDQKADAGAWLGFLDLLKKQRPRRPLNGAIITISVSDLLIWNDAERARYCDAVRQRVQELYTRLGVRFPLYVMVTKCDLLAGFNEFYAAFSKEERSQVWGMTFPLKAEAGTEIDFGKLFDAEFGALEQRLVGTLPDRLQAERDQQRRALIYNFVQQFDGLRNLLGDFVKSTFQGSRYGEKAMLRGVYFTSGTQEGSPIDRVLGTLSRSFKIERKVLAPSAGSGKSFFLTNLLKELVFPEAGLVGASAKFDRQLRVALICGYVLVAVTLFAFMALWGVSYYNNRALIAEFDVNTQAVKQQIDKLPAPRAGDLATVYPALTALRALAESRPEAGRGVPLSLGVGLYQGDKLVSQAHRTYQNALRDVLLPRIALRLEELIRDGNPVAQYDALKAYLMLYTDKVLDPKLLSAFVARDWQQTYRGAEQAQFVKAMQEHLQTALADRPIEMVQPQNSLLVAELRQRLASASLPDRIYTRLLREVEQNDVAPFRISEAAGPAAGQVFARASKAPLSEGIPGLFTSAGYFKVIRPKLSDVTNTMLTEESWVLGQKLASGTRVANMVQVQDEVRRRYFAEFGKAWEDLFTDLQLVSSSSLVQSQQLVRLLSGPDSPLKRLLEQASKELALTEPADTAVKGSLAKAAADAAADLAKKALGAVGAAVPDAVAERPEAATVERFRRLRLYVTAAAGARAPIDMLADQLREYGVKLDAAAGQRPDPANSRMVDVGQLRAEVDQAPAPVQQVVKSLLEVSVSQVTGQMTEELRKKVAGTGLFCAQALKERYPFVKGAASDVTLDDFSKVFGPGGDLDEVFKTTLAPLVDTSRPQWTGRAGEGAKLSGQTIAQFQRAAEIRNAFFRVGNTPAAAGELRLVALDERISHLTLEIDNQVLRFDRVATVPVRVGWPSRAGSRVRLQAYPSGAAYTFEGQWALFKLFDRGNPQVGPQPEQMKLVFSFDGQGAGFELRASSAVNNPFNLRTLEGFRCP